MAVGQKRNSRPHPARRRRYTLQEKLYKQAKSKKTMATNLRNFNKTSSTLFKINKISSNSSMTYEEEVTRNVSQFN